MKMSEINKVFTDKVAEYMAKGYVIHVQSMSGHQGEVGKVDLVKGDELIRIWMDDTSGTYKEHYADAHRSIVVGRWYYPAKEASFRTVWLGEFEVLEGIKFYEISCGEWYVEDFEEALRIRNLRTHRWSNKRLVEDTEYLTGDAHEIAVRYLKRKVGYRRVSLDAVEVTKKTLRDSTILYYVNYKGHSYRLQ